MAIFMLLKCNGFSGQLLWPTGSRIPAGTVKLIAALDQFERSFEVGKQDGDVLSLALDGGSGSEDLFCEMRRRV